MCLSAISTSGNRGEPCGSYGCPYRPRHEPFIPAPPGHTPRCAKPGQTFCEEPDHYPHTVQIRARRGLFRRFLGGTSDSLGEASRTMWQHWRRSRELNEDGISFCEYARKWTVAKMVEENQKRLQAEIDVYKQIQKDYHKALVKRQQLDGQLNENTAVKEELDLLKPGNEVFKLIGPVLVKQDLVEAKQNVAKRMEYISNELKRTEDLMAELDKKQEAHRETLDKLQQVFHQAQMKASRQS